MSTAVAQYAANTSDTGGGWVGGSGAGGSPATGDTVDVHGFACVLDTPITGCTLIDAVGGGSLTINSASYPPADWTVSAGAAMVTGADIDWSAYGKTLAIAGTFTINHSFVPSGLTLSVLAGGLVTFGGSSSRYYSPGGTIAVYGTFEHNSAKDADYLGYVTVYSGGVLAGVTGAYNRYCGGITSLTVNSGGTYTNNGAWWCAAASFAAGSILTINGVRVYAGGGAALSRVRLGM